jgi:hypothetical protein
VYESPSATIGPLSEVIAAVPAGEADPGGDAVPATDAGPAGDAVPAGAVVPAGAGDAVPAGVAGPEAPARPDAPAVPDAGTDWGATATLAARDPGLDGCPLPADEHPAAPSSPASSRATVIRPLSTVTRGVFPGLIPDQ